ncbi:hypothetical protein A1OE_1118 [Candidatus Endolissoclinum faulkneri L2]|uniref:Uncharacterized protein n=1 Tax=Candidatus Endolissoclinum faulkneri L2 TaxID=1193729 RepID=K7ZD86_9PROT|nr:hypothetical protein A1OE_1118 [Candidatus Endolissoclinum faulkneri L2]
MQSLRLYAYVRIIFLKSLKLELSIFLFSSLEVKLKQLHLTHTNQVKI